MAYLVRAVEDLEGSCGEWWCVCESQTRVRSRCPSERGPGRVVQPDGNARQKVVKEIESRRPAELAAGLARPARRHGPGEARQVADGLGVPGPSPRSERSKRSAKRA